MDSEASFSIDDGGAHGDRPCRTWRIRQIRQLPVVLWAALLLLAAALPRGADAQTADLYQTSVLPYVQAYCAKCHNSEVAKGELNFSRYADSRDVAGSFRRWNNVIEFIRSGEMPPAEADQPSIEASNAVVASIEEILLREARKRAGDPGAILPRRLSNTEYDLSIRELTGVDIRPTRDFPADPAGGEGFDNTGEALAMSPSLLKKHLAAAQLVSDHLVLKPDGISFAQHPVTSYNERKKLTEQAVIDFYLSHEVETLEYLDAAWRYRHRGSDREALSIERWAAERGLSPKYLAIVWKALSEADAPPGFLQELGRLWEALPAPVDAKQQPPELTALGRFVEFGKRILGAPEPPLIRSNAGNWPISHLAFREATAAARDQFDKDALKNETLLKIMKVKAPAAGAEAVSAFIRVDPAFSGGHDYVVVKRPQFSQADRLSTNGADERKNEVQSLRSVLEELQPELVAQLGFGKHPAGGETDPEWIVLKAPAILEIPLSVELQKKLAGKNLLALCQLDPEHSLNGSVLVQHSVRRPARSRITQGAELLVFDDSEVANALAAAGGVFCNAFPNRFFYVDNGRGLAAGFHLVEGFFRDDRPLVEKVLSDSQRAELDRLWRELDFVTQSAEGLLRGFVWFERSEREVLHDKRFDFLRPEDPQLVESGLLDKFEKLYLDKLGVKRRGDTLEAEAPDDKYRMIHGFFEQIREGLAEHNELLQRAEPRALDGLRELARRACRRPLRPGEWESLETLYRKLRTEGQSVEEALRGVLTAVLMSPDFCYRYHAAPAGTGIAPLSDYELASRLSYFLWSSLPDEELLAAAAAGKLQSEDALADQARRMLKDPRISALAREFFGQWLRYRDYLAKDPIHAAAFPTYDDALREAMFAEPVRLASHLIQTDQPVTELLNSDRTFVNRVLASHYGGDLEQQYLRLQAEAAASSIASSRGRRDEVDPAQDWRMVSGLRAAGRGGLFGMAVILAKNSAGERTSPVKRGFWTVHHLLGQHFPPPPADVPELPATEKSAPRTIRELLAAHVADAQCALCHKHFDSLGVAMEGFDPIGRLRAKDLAGRPIDNLATFPSGDSARGVPGLIQYVEEHRRKDFVRTMCRKLLGYALGRSVELSDQPLLSEMEAALENNDFRFSAMFDVVVRSPQFRRQRERDFAVGER